MIKFILFSVIWFGLGPIHQEPPNCIEMCKVKYIYAHMLYGINPDLVSFEKCKKKCKGEEK